MVFGRGSCIFFRNLALLVGVKIWSLTCKNDVDSFNGTLMPKALQVSITAIALALLTAAACALGIVNFLRQIHFELPTDGVSWIEIQGGLRAERVPVNSPAQRAGIRPGDVLIAVDEHPTPRVATLNRQIWRHGVWSRG